MNNELKLKHIAPYLPYGVKYFYKDKIKELVNLHYFYSFDEYGEIAGKSECTRMYNSKFGEMQYLITAIKPILRPLSDIVKEVEIEGDRFVPIQEIGNNIYGDCKIWDIDDNGNHIVGFTKYDKHGEPYGVGLECLNLKNDDFEEVSFGLFDDRFVMPKSFSNPPISYSAFELMLSWHFDVFGLIDKGLAINYNDL